MCRGSRRAWCLSVAQSSTGRPVDGPALFPGTCPTTIEPARCGRIVRPVEFELFETIVCDSAVCHARCVCPSRSSLRGRHTGHSLAAPIGHVQPPYRPRAPCPDRCCHFVPSLMCCVNSVCLSRRMVQYESSSCQRHAARRPARAAGRTAQVEEA